MDDPQVSCPGEAGESVVLTSAQQRHVAHLPDVHDVRLLPGGRGWPRGVNGRGCQEASLNASMATSLDDDRRETEQRYPWYGGLAAGWRRWKDMIPLSGEQCESRWIYVTNSLWRWECNNRWWQQALRRIDILTTAANESAEKCDPESPFQFSSVLPRQSSSTIQLGVVPEHALRIRQTTLARQVVLDALLVAERRVKDAQ